ncbi:hypothetical protein EYZ11_013466 [Aspergillus tanneri]|uniref:Uncharacterized protein n=1 Tax=Aspergillus tanneri TaxID=1220188 RepID=A0A4S3IZU1_9EURO|nr:hypothetical protein EYZ11_013466 [Aspergillus tanneri]
MVQHSLQLLGQPASSEVEVLRP